MLHSIEFRAACVLDVEISPGQPLQQVKVYRGTRARAEIHPYVIETDIGPVEVADLEFSDGPTSRMVPFACFRFRERSH